MYFPLIIDSFKNAKNGFLWSVRCRCLEVLRKRLGGFVVPAHLRHDEKDVNSLSKGGVGVKLSARKTHVDFRRGLRSC